MNNHSKYRKYSAIVFATVFSFLLYSPLHLAQEADEGELVVIEDLTEAELEEEILLAEAEFHRLFNLHNGNKDFDIECRREVATGTHMPGRVCEARYVTAARQENINNFTRGLDVRLSPEAIQMMLEKETEEMNTIYLQMLKDRPQFLEIVQILDLLRARLAQVKND